MLLYFLLQATRHRFVNGLQTNFAFLYGPITWHPENVSTSGSDFTSGSGLTSGLTSGVSSLIS